MQSFIARVNCTIKKRGLLVGGEKIILGVSGGPDSVTLFYTLLALQKKLNLSFVLAHVNYQGRSGANKDEQLVRRMAQKNKLPCYVLRVREEKISLFNSGKEQTIKFPKNYFKKALKIPNQENRFRVWRYLFFDWVLQESQGQKIAVAHQANDQAETIILHFLRGSGLAGLGGMNYQSGLLIRPLLDVYRQEIEAFLTKNQWSSRKDPTNKSNSYQRNRVRQKLIPLLEKEFNPRIVATLHRNADCFRETNELINDWAEEKLKKADFSLSCFNRVAEFCWPDLTNESPALRGAVIRLVIKKMEKAVVDLGREQPDNFWQKLKKTNLGESFVFLNRWEVKKEKKRVCLKRLNNL